MSKRPPKPPIEEAQLAGWKLVERFMEVLQSHSSQIAPGSRETHGLRQLDRTRYFALFLFGLFNPVVDSMRALCSATKLGAVKALLGADAHGPVAISNFSDAQQVFAPEILEPVMRHLLTESIARQAFTLPGGRIAPETIHIFDSTVWKVVTRMAWANWRHQHQEQKAVRLHVKLRLADLQVHGAEVSEGKVCERAAMRRLIKPGEFYLGDRNYGADLKLFAELEAAGCGYVLRLPNTTTWEAVEKHVIPPQAAAQGVTLDAMVHLGRRGDGSPRRLVILRREDSKEDIILVTSEPLATLEALEVTGLYRQRWQVEMFFRWLKCLVPCRHWFAESRRGVGIQIYLVLIKALLLAELTGGKPNKRMMELLHWHQVGMVTDEELGRLLAGEERARQKKIAAVAAKKKA